MGSVLPRVDDLRIIREVPATPRDRLSLGAVVRLVDLTASLLASAVTVVVGASVGTRYVDTPLWVLFVALPAIALVSLTAVGAYQRRKCAIASVEISRVGRAVTGAALLLLLVLQAADSGAPYTTTVIAITLLFGALVVGRGWFRHWVKAARGEGRFLTPVAVVGDSLTAQRFAERLLANPDGGYLPVAQIGIDRDDDGRLFTHHVPQVGVVGDHFDRLIAAGVRSAVVLSPHLTTEELNVAVRSLQRSFDHVQVVTSLAGVAHSRLVPTPLVDETTFYLEPVVASTWQRAVKRVTDVVVASMLLVVTMPVLLVAAVLIKLTDRGPVLYAQERVGLDGRAIRIWKLRSMVVDADRMLAELAAGNDRKGPLFKSGRDPRITRVGRVIRATSIDELPQLWSILVGDMSLVGPRPALAAEVAEFDSTHRRRHEVRPGLTGLWQVEDRDHPDFERYRRHDVFYVENWSLSLDLAIILQTAAAVLARAVRAAVPGGDDVGV